MEFEMVCRKKWERQTAFKNTQIAHNASAFF